MAIKEELTIVGKAAVKAFRLLRRKDPMMLASSTAFFTTFALSPISIILIQVFSLYYSTDRINHQLFRVIGSVLGQETARDLERIVTNMSSIETNWPLTIAGFIFFLFVGTTLLRIVKTAIQRIWHIRSRPGIHIKHFLRERGSFLVFILFTGLLIFLSFFINVRIQIALDYINAFWGNFAIQAVYVLNAIFSVIIVIAWFTLLFKYVPEANISWDTAFSGGLMTGILFAIGRFALGRILLHARIATIFGASASLALLLLFIFYVSFILYYGAAFTYHYASLDNRRICPSKYSEEYEERIIERNSEDIRF